MLFMVKIVVRLPGDWPKEKLEEINRNETARSMGQPDVYPFVMNRAAVTKLHFVQCVIEERGRGGIVPPTERLATA